MRHLYCEFHFEYICKDKQREDTNSGTSYIETPTKYK